MTTIHSIKECLENPSLANHQVTVQGWVKTRRDSKAGLSFISLHDGSCFAPLQLIAPQSLVNYQDEILKLTAGCAVKATGELTPSLGKGQTFELQVTELEVVGWVDHPESYPIQAKRHTLEFLREVAHLRPRTNTIGAVTRIRHCLAQAIHRFFDEKGFFWIHTPIITSSDCEGAGEMFRVSTLDLCNLPKTQDNRIDFTKDFFGRETFLTVSGQLNVETYCMAMSKVYTFGPTFRAENSNTSRHLAEFWMVEPELAFANLSDICILSQEMLRYLCQSVLERREDDMHFLNQFVSPGCIDRLKHLIDTPCEIMSYTDAIQALSKAKRTFQYPVAWGTDLQSEHERYIAEELCQSPVIITDYPKEIKGFYMRLNDDNRTVAAMDLLAPGIGEIIGGSQREERLDILDQRIEEAQLEKEAYNWYRDLRRYGTVPHAGFGLGFERLINYVTGIPNVRDVIPFPRTPGHADY
ncbi:MAG: asparagine--tRNA ligase [Legionella sp.]|nr:asparagine--tRNA ligase [Legionella sp.]